MNYRFLVPAMCVALLFASQTLQAASLPSSDMGESASVMDSTAVVSASDPDREKVVSHVYHYNSILSKTVTTEERNDTVLESKIRWNLSFSLPAALSGDNQKSLDGKKVNANRPMKLEACYPLLFFGLAGLSSDDFRLKTGNSWEWGMYPISGALRFPNRSCKRASGFTAALGFSRTSYRLKGDDVFHVSDDGMTVCSPKEDLDYHKQRLVYWSWRLPVSYQCSFRADKQVYFFSVGAEGELRHHVRSRAHVGHMRKYIIDSGSLAVNPWACNLMLQFGTDDCGVFARYALTDFFDKGSTALQGIPFMIGFSLGF